MAEEVKFQKVNGKSLDIEAVDKEKLKKIFPQCFNEGKLDINKLLSLCGEYIDNDFEKYKFEWKGKSECYRIAGKRSTGTLRPCPKESVDFENTNNLYIEGDNLEVLKLLQTAYYRKVKMIYIDPPYNTGNDFVYEDDFKDPLAKYKEITSQTTKSNPETMGRYHTNWLNMMFPRLRLAANLLRDDGVIFISIDDNEVTNLRRLCDEVFGEENFVADFQWKKKSTTTNVEGVSVSSLTEHILCYKKAEKGINNRIVAKEERSYPFSDEQGNYRKTIIEKKNEGEYARKTMEFSIIGHKPREGKRWQIGEDKVLKLDTSNLVKWDDTPTDSEEDLFNRMDGMVKSLKNDRSELDVVFEVMLKLGIPPTYKVNEISVNGRKVYSIGDDGLVLICLDSANGGITPEDISAMCDLAPAKIVAAEEAFKDDIALSNAYYISKDKGIEIELL